MSTKKKNLESEKEIVSLNSNILESTSIEELEQRLEFGTWLCGCFTPCDGCPGGNFRDGYGCCPTSETVHPS